LRGGERESGRERERERGERSAATRERERERERSVGMLAATRVNIHEFTHY
jgi:hypothetical protein